MPVFLKVPQAVTRREVTLSGRHRVPTVEVVQVRRGDAGINATCSGGWDQNEMWGGKDSLRKE